MATVVSTPQKIFAAAVIPGTAIGQSANITVALSFLGWEGVVPFVGFQPNTANISAGWEAYAYRSTDNGATYETVSSYFRSVSRQAPTTVADRLDVTLPSGQYFLRMVSGGGSAGTWSFSIGTQEIITAINNV